jgi:hypothetical protein
VRHNTTYWTFAARSDHKSAPEYAEFEYAALPVNVAVFTSLCLCGNVFECQSTCR